jgi:Uma2 family endonuclease
LRSRDEVKRVGRLSPDKKLTYEEFLAWCDEDTLVEWVDGEVVTLSPASEQHEDLRSLLDAVLRIFVEQRGLGRVLGASFQMRLAEPVRSGRQPDILFVAANRVSCLKETYLDGPADLVVEIISPESRLRDRGEKFAEYEMGGVREYWLLDPERREADFYGLDERGRYRAQPDREGWYESLVISGFRLKVEWLWQVPLPKVLDVVSELGLLGPAQTR